ncbi:MAG: hypothetical protein Kow0025_07410 [Thermodesulfovibrionales bacterium]
MRGGSLLVLPVLGLMLFLAAPGFGAAVPSSKIALLPFENLTDDRDAEGMVMPAVKERLNREGVELVDEDSLNRVLFRERVRATAYISRDMARKLGEELGARAVLLGCIVRFEPGENPSIGLASRLIDTSTGKIIWADYASASGVEFAGILGLWEIKTMEKLIPRAADRLLDSFSLEPPERKEPPYRIAVMPLKNNSGTREAGTATTFMFVSELFKSRRFEAVEYGDVRRAILRLRTVRKGELDLKTLGELSRTLEVDGVLVGTVERYAGTEYGTASGVEMIVRLLDAKEQRILWYDSLQQSGEKSIIVFSWETVRPVDETALRAVAELIERMEKIAWRP